MSVEDLPRTLDLAPDARFASVIDQTVLPQKLEVLRVTTWCQMVDLIKRLAVRGAPALGVAGAFALALFCVNEYGAGAGDAGEAGIDGINRARATSSARFFRTALAQVADSVATARPTAVNLAWGTRRAQRAAERALDQGASVEQAIAALIAEARAIRNEDEASCRAIGANGAALLQSGSRVLTHCNAGSLATAFYGTALGVVYAAFDQGKIAHVYADETRPVGQGARLTAWELTRAGVPTTLLCDNMAASLMAQGAIDAVIVGADRICANGDVANKIGTYGVAVLAHHHGIPFYVAAPQSTIDAALTSGNQIPIEYRDASEVSAWQPEGLHIHNPAFDVTPADLVSAIITEHGVFRPPYDFAPSMPHDRMNVNQIPDTSAR